MKIAFICAGLEAGGDGVGDYTRRLAAGCAAQGHDCRLFAVNDRRVTGDDASESLPGGTPAHRWSARRPWRARVAAVQEAIARFAPDWVSWQFVSYGFDPKGITPAGLIALARRLQPYHSQVMLHETWIGIARGDSAWARLTGWRQQRALQSFLRALRPAQIQTSNASYAALLARAGWSATVLPLFGNIPVLPAPANVRDEILARHAPASRPRAGVLLAVTFGTLHPQWQPEATGEWLLQQARLAGKRPLLLAAGRTGRHGAALLARLARTGVEVVATGELPPAEISRLLQAADCGIALHPRALAGKSGAVAAMRDHGLPVLFPRDDWQLRDGIAAEEPADARLACLGSLYVAAGAAWLRRRSVPRDALPGVVNQFLDCLRLNLLFYAPIMAAYGGIERHVCTLAARAAQRGHRVTLLTTSNSLGADLRAELAHPRLELRELPAARRQAGKFTKLRWLAGEVIRARRENWDVIYTNGQGALARLVWFAARGPARRIHHHHTAADAREQATWSPGFREVLRRAPEVIACSAATRDAINAAVARPVVYLPYLTSCPVAPAAIHTRPAAPTLHFGFLGRLIPEKGIATICRLSARPELAGIAWHVHGTGPAYPPESFAAWPRLVYHGAFHGAAAQAQALLALDAVVLFSTHNEGMPLSLIEAMSAGLPWVATDRGGTRELALSPPDALVVAPDATDAVLAAAVLELARRIRAGETSRAAQRHAYDRHFSPAVAEARWLGFLEGVPTAGAA